MKVGKLVRTIVLSIGIITVMSMTAFAADPVDVSGVLSSEGKVENNQFYVGNTLIGDVKTKPEGDYVKGIQIGGTTYFITGDEDTKMNQAAADIVAANQVAASDTSASGVASKINQVSQNYQITADTDRASTALGGFKDTLSILVGALVIITLLGLTAVSAIDLVYLSVPPIRSWLDSMGEKGESTTKDGTPKFKFVSDEAVFALKKSVNGESYSSPMVLYIKTRIAYIIASAIAVYLLVSGQSAALIVLALKLISGIIDMLSSAAA